MYRPDLCRGSANADARALARPFVEEMRAALLTLRAATSDVLRDEEEVDDLLQECLLLAWTDRARFSETSEPGAWFLDHLRVALCSSESRNDQPFRYETMQAGVQLAREDQEIALRCAETLRAFRRVPAPLRQALELIASGVSYEDAAIVCGCCLGTFKSRLTRARHLLAELVDGSP
jgi:RNA polymerase sigma-70 factor (ECF subfamily)